MMRQSLSGNGRPIDPVQFSPSKGLQWVAVGASDRPYPSKTVPPVRASNFSLVSRIKGAEPEIQPLIVRRLYLPANTSGWLLMALYSVGTPGKTVALYFWILVNTSFKARGLGTMTIAAPVRRANSIPATKPYTW